jgi:hypothetical protein
MKWEGYGRKWSWHFFNIVVLKRLESFRLSCYPSTSGWCLFTGTFTRTVTWRCNGISWRHVTVCLFTDSAYCFSALRDANIIRLSVGLGFLGIRHLPSAQKVLCSKPTGSCPICGHLWLSVGCSCLAHSRIYIYIYIYISMSISREFSYAVHSRLWVHALRWGVVC